jgi:hypothetical protein
MGEWRDCMRTQLVAVTQRRPDLRQVVLTASPVGAFALLSRDTLSAHLCDMWTFQCFLGALSDRRLRRDHLWSPGCRYLYRG